MPSSETNDSTKQSIPENEDRERPANHNPENANGYLKPEVKYLFRRRKTQIEQQNPERDQQEGEQIAEVCALQLHVNSNDIFVGEPLYFSISIGKERPAEFEHDFLQAFLECEDSAGNTLHHSVRYASAGVGYAPNKGKSYYGIICPAVYPEDAGRNSPDIQEEKDYFVKPGDYNLRAWVMISASSYISSQEVSVSVREPNEYEARSVKYFKKSDYVFLSPMSSCIELPVKDYQELSEMVTGDPNLPLRDELTMLLAGATFAYMQNTANYDPRLIQQELLWRANTPVSKPHMRWIANSNGEFISKYFGFADRRGYESIDWELLLKSWTENPPLLTQLADYEMEYYDKRMAALEKICERRAEQRALGFLPE